MSVAEQLCTEVGIIADGELVAQRDPREFEDGGLLDTFVTEVEGSAGTPGAPVGVSDE
jgi:ABC-2 type transport system ATP-binding protein